MSAAEIKTVRARMCERAWVEAISPLGEDKSAVADKDTGIYWE